MAQKIHSHSHRRRTNRIKNKAVAYATAFLYLLLPGVFFALAEHKSAVAFLLYDYLHLVCVLYAIAHDSSVRLEMRGVPLAVDVHYG